MKHTLARFVLAVSLASGGLANAAAGSLTDACDATQYTWGTSGDADWFFQTATTHDGIDAARSGPIGYNGTSVMELEVTGPGTLTYWWKVDSENNDTLSVHAAGAGNSHAISGDSGWTQVSLNLASGTQTITWTYTKESNVTSGEDAGWVDQVYFAADSDSELPTLQYINFSPDPVDVSSSSMEVTITLEISDDKNGVSGGFVDLFDSLGNNYDGASFDSSNRISGDESSGTYQVTITIDESRIFPVGTSRPGGWSAFVELEERITGDFRFYGPDDEPFPNPDDATFTVIGGASGELGISSIDTLSPDPVDISTSAQTVTLNFTLNDPYAEFDRGIVNFRDSSNQQVAEVPFNASTGSGNQQFLTLDVPRYGPQGLWSVDFTLFDPANNVTYVSGFIQAPGDNLVEVVNSGTVDSTAPVLSSIAITPTSINTAEAPADITITANVSDNLVGMAYAVVDFFDPTNTLVSSLQTIVPNTEIAGGSFTAIQSLPQGSLEGGWRCQVTVRDLLGNIHIYGTGTGTNDVPFPVPSNAKFYVGIAVGPTFEQFANFYSLAGNEALPASNPDHDWANNALELILGLDPTQADQSDSALYQSTRVGSELRLDFKIASDLTVTSSGNFLLITKAGSSPPLQVTGQTATSLNGPWTNIVPQPQGGDVYRVTLPIGPGDKGFSRLKFIDP